MNKVIICAKEYPSRVTMGAMIDFKRETGKDVNEIGADIEQLTMFMYCCVRSACRADKMDFQLTFEQFADGINLEDFTAFQNGMQLKKTGQKKRRGRERNNRISDGDGDGMCRYVSERFLPSHSIRVYSCL